jgi:GNAT superfamily N-acetyltransferase
MDDALMPVMQIEYVETTALDARQRRAVLDLCRAAYDEDLAHYLADIGPGVHALGCVQGTLVAHAMIVRRELHTAGHVLQAAYVELVATLPRAQRRGHGSAVLQALAGQMDAFDIGALSPSDAQFYARLGWELWRGPLLVRTDGGVVPSPPDEQVMVRRLPRTPADLDVHAPLSVEWRPGEVW